MAQARRDQPITPADELRTLLADCERQIANVRRTGAQTLELLTSLDRIAELWPLLEHGGLDLRPEGGRWETLKATLHKNAPRLIDDMRAVGGLQKVRAERYGDRQAPEWWNLVEEVRANRFQRLRTVAMIAAGVVFLGMLAVFALNRLFPEDPRLKASLASQGAGQQKIEQHQDYQGALNDFSAAVTAKPDEVDAWLWLGVTQQKLGDLQGARSSFDTAQTLVGGEFNLHLARVPYYISVNLLTDAETDVQAVLKQDPENPQAYYYLASIYENQDRIQDAVMALQRTSDLAEARKQVELTALARYRMAMMMQQVQARSFVAPAPSPTP